MDRRLPIKMNPWKKTKNMQNVSQQLGLCHYSVKKDFYTDYWKGYTTIYRCILIKMLR